MSLIFRRSLSRPYYILKGDVDPVIVRAISRTLTYIPADAAHTASRNARNPANHSLTGVIEECLLDRASTGEWFFPSGVLPRVTEMLDSVDYDYVVENDVELPGDPIGVEWKTDKVLRDYQQDVAETAYLNGGGTICLPTGAGKTLICLRLVYAFDHRTLVIVHSRELMKQWRTEIQQVLGIDPGMVGGGFKENWDDVTIASVQTLASRLKRGKLAEVDLNYPVLVADECFPFDAPVVTYDGIVPIGEIVEKQLPVKVLTHTGEYRDVLAYHKIPLKNRFVRVYHERGSFICTEDHKIRTERGWVEAINLTKADVVYSLIDLRYDCPFKKSPVRDVVVLGPKTSAGTAIASRNNWWKDADAKPYVYDITVDIDHSFVADGVIVSNCHHLPANDVYTVAMLYNSPVRIGLTATPVRTDGREMRIWGAIGDICSHVTPVELIKRGYLTRPRFVILDPPYVKMRAVRDWQEAYYDGIVANQFRNQMIVDTARELIADGHKVYVHVERIEHGEILAVMFDDVPFIHGSTPKKDRDETIVEFAGDDMNCVISTLLGEGVDIPRMTAIIMAGGLKTPVGVVQKVGRALRLSPGKDEAIVVDFRDKGPWISRHFQERMNVYRETYGEYVKG